MLGDIMLGDISDPGPFWPICLEVVRTPTVPPFFIQVYFSMWSFNSQILEKNKFSRVN